MQNPEWSALAERVRGVKPGARAAWGKMELAQMLTHCRLQFECSLGSYATSPNDTRSLKKTLMRWMVFTLPWMKGRTPTHPDFMVLEKKLPVRSPEEERDALADALARFARGGFAPRPHPLLGPLDLGQWTTLMQKHLDYHLRQFGG